MKCGMFVCVGVAKCVTNIDGSEVKCIFFCFLIIQLYTRTHTHTHTHTRQTVRIPELKRNFMLPPRITQKSTVPGTKVIKQVWYIAHNLVVPGFLGGHVMIARD